MLRSVTVRNLIQAEGALLFYRRRRRPHTAAPRGQSREMTLQTGAPGSGASSGRTAASLPAGGEPPLTLGGKLQDCSDIVTRKLRKLMENLLRRHPRRQILQDIVHSDAATLNARFSRPDAWIYFDPIHQILHVPSIVVSEPGGQFIPYRTNERARRFLLVADHHRDGDAQAPNRGNAAQALRISCNPIKHRDLRLVGYPHIGLSPSPADSVPPSRLSPLD